MSSEQSTWYQKSPDEVMDDLQTSLEGLNSSEIGERQQQYGPNEIEFKKTPWWLQFARQFKNFISLILFVAAAISVATGSNLDALVIMAVVIINAIIGFAQEGSAAKAVEALKKTMAKMSMTVRDGNELRITARELVPGDVILLKAGDEVPADARVIISNNGRADESALTGESEAAHKTTGTLEGGDLVEGDQENMVFSGTFIVQGKITAVVTDTGGNTVFGRIAETLKKDDGEKTPLNKNVDVFLIKVVKYIFILGIINFVVSLFTDRPIAYNLIGTISLIVAAIPATLPAMLTAVYTRATHAMKESNALVTRLPTSVVLGDVTVICSDKTGTLTQNQMTVMKVWSGGDTFDVTEGEQEFTGRYLRNGEPVEPKEHPALTRLLGIGHHCNDARLLEIGSDGEATEVALLIAAAKARIRDGEAERLEEIEFNSTRKYMAVLVRIEGKNYIFVKGAPEVILPMCSRDLSADGGTQELEQEMVLEVASSFAQKALRTLAFAFAEVPEDHEDLRHDDLRGLTLAGLQGMIDPPKDSAREAIVECKQAGIRVVMITGDHPETAQAIARELGIDAGRVVIGGELSLMDEEAMREVVKNVSVFARVSPEHKRQLAVALKENSEIVAMTGDGINDAPALKEAHVGVAMGKQGTDVARQAADLILLDDDFATIPKAIEVGRDAFEKISRKAFIYTIPTNFAQVLLVIGAVFMGIFVPFFGADYVLVPIMILWINLLDAVLWTIPLIYEQIKQGLLLKLPRDASASIFDSFFLARTVLMGVAIAIPPFFVYWHFGSAAVVDGVVVDPILLVQAQTAAFWSVIISHLGYVVSARDVEKSVFSFEPWIIPFGNKVLLGGIAISILIRLLPTFVPEAAAIFKTEEFPLEWWPMILVSFFPSFIAIEADKWIRSRKKSRTELKTANETA